MQLRVFEYHPTSSVVCLSHVDCVLGRVQGQIRVQHWTVMGVRKNYLKKKHIRAKSAVQFQATFLGQIRSKIGTRFRDTLLVRVVK